MHLFNKFSEAPDTGELNARKPHLRPKAGFESLTIYANVFCLSCCNPVMITVELSRSLSDDDGNGDSHKLRITDADSKLCLHLVKCRQ